MPFKSKNLLAIGFFCAWILFAGYLESRNTSTCTICQTGSFCPQPPNSDPVFFTDRTDDETVSPDATDDLTDIQRQYNDSILPVLKESCRDCHWGKTASAGFNLESYRTIDQLLNARETWQKVKTLVANKQMPPEDAEPLPDADHQAILTWIDKLFRSVDCTDINPGQVTIRRLNRIEYRNTVRDLIGVDYEPAADFPGDDVGYGFDNIADVISLPPILMEKYLQAAEQITAQAIVDPTVPRFEKRLLGSELKPNNQSKIYQTNIVLFSNTTLDIDFQLPLPGKYAVSIQTFGDQTGDEPVKMSLQWNDKKVSDHKIVADQESLGLIQHHLNGKRGSNRLGISFLNDAYQPSGPDQIGFDRNLHIKSVELKGPLDKLPATHRKLFPKKIPTRSTAQKKLARKILNRFATRAFRRPATPDELDRLTKLFDEAIADGDRFEIAMRLPLQAILVSPRFLYKIETPVATGKERELNDFELATSLSYFLWSTMPDEELFQLAANGKLQNAKIYRQQVYRMLADTKSSALVDNFVEQWLQLRHLEDFQPDPDLFPNIDRNLRLAMITETKMMFHDLIKRDGGILDLLESNYSHVNQPLAELYGLKGVTGKHFRKVSMEPVERTGLLSHASILTLTSNPTRTSPVRRGKWIMENLLGEEPPPPDPNAMQLEDQQELTGSIRQRMEQHRTDPNCAACHKVMDELGFALEHYDAVGRWRNDDSGQRIDDLGVLPDGTRFEGAAELQNVLKTKMKDQFVRCLTEKMLIYATGRGLQYYDVCAVDKIVEQLEQKNYRFSELIYHVTTSDPFVKRKRQPGQTAETK